MQLATNARHASVIEDQRKNPIPPCTGHTHTQKIGCPDQHALDLRRYRRLGSFFRLRATCNFFPRQMSHSTPQCTKQHFCSTLRELKGTSLQVSTNSTQGSCAPARQIYICPEQFVHGSTRVHHLSQASAVVRELCPVTRRELAMKDLRECLLTTDAIRFITAQLEQQAAMRPTRDALDHDKGTSCPQCTARIRLAVQGFDVLRIRLKDEKAPLGCMRARAIRAPAIRARGNKQPPCEGDALPMCVAT